MSSLIRWKLFMVAVCIVQVASSEATIVCLQSKNKQWIQGVDQMTSLSTEYEAFLGIPYAKPPIAELRFANPVPNDPWAGVYDATEPKPVCIQRNDILPPQGVVGSEDCLHLNVYRPKNATQKLPVLVYIHGGGFLWGSAGPEMSGPDRFMNSREVILVTVSYRLGALGFLSTGDSVAPGNYAFKDQSMAIRWVRKHIREFGGDRHLITVLGDSAGGAATQLHMMSPLSRGSFTRAIMMSGSALAPFAEPDPDPMRIARLQAGVLGLTLNATLTSLEVIAYLRRIPVEQLVGSITAVQKMIDPIFAVTIYRPVIEQYVEGQSFLHESPLTLWESGNYEQIPWMMGHVPNEGVVYEHTVQGILSNSTQLVADLPIGANELLQHSSTTIDLTTLSPKETVKLWIRVLTAVEFYYPMMKSVTQHLQQADQTKAPVNLYYFNFTGPYSVSSYFVPGSTYPIVHNDDVLYLFNRPALFPDFEFGSPGYLMATKMVQLVVEFARTGRAFPGFQGTCPSKTHCQQIDLENADMVEDDPVQVRLTNAINSELMGLLDGLSNSSRIVVASSYDEELESSYVHYS